jgi:outer membrane receptor protein involved in Fe transport
VTATPNQPIEAPGFTTVRLAFDYAFRAHRMDFRTNLVVSNLFDKKFYRGYNRGEPRAVSLSLTTTY